MEWYGWVLVIAGAVALAGLKIWLAPKWLKARREKQQARQAFRDEDE